MGTCKIASIRLERCIQNENKYKRWLLPSTNIQSNFYVLWTITICSMGIIYTFYRLFFGDSISSSCIIYSGKYLYKRVGRTQFSVCHGFSTYNRYEIKGVKAQRSWKCSNGRNVYLHLVSNNMLAAFKCTFYNLQFNVIHNRNVSLVCCDLWVCILSMAILYLVLDVLCCLATVVQFIFMQVLHLGQSAFAKSFFRCIIYLIMCSHS